MTRIRAFQIVLISFPQEDGTRFGMNDEIEILPSAQRELKALPLEAGDRVAIQGLALNRQALEPCKGLQRMLAAAPGKTYDRFSRH